MPNGMLHDEKWDRMEAPLKRLDHLFETFAEKTGLEIEKNYHNWPSRSLRWESGRIIRKVDVFAQDNIDPRYVMAAVAWFDRGTARYIKQQQFFQSVHARSLRGQVSRKLKSAFDIASAWKADDLERINVRK